MVLFAAMSDAPHIEEMHRPKTGATHNHPCSQSNQRVNLISRLFGQIMRYLAPLSFYPRLLDLTLKCHEQHVSQLEQSVLPGIYRDKTMADKFMHIPNDDTKNYPICRLQFDVERFSTSRTKITESPQNCKANK